MSKASKRGKENTENTTTVTFLENDTDDITEETDFYSNQIIDDIIDEKIYQVCSNMSSYIKNYQYETALPFAEYLDYGSIHDFIRYMGREQQ